MVRPSRIADRVGLDVPGKSLVALRGHHLKSLTLRVAAAAVATALAACASSPMTLVALPRPAPFAPDATTPAAPVSAPVREAHLGSIAASIAAPVNVGGPPATLLLREVTLPQYLDSFQVLVGRRGNVLLMSDTTEWAERLPVAATRVLRDALSQRLGSTRMLLAGERRPADAELALEFVVLDPDQRALDLEARWLLSCRAAGRSYRGGRVRLQVALESATPAAVATAISAALGRLATALTDELRCESPAQKQDS